MDWLLVVGLYLSLFSGGVHSYASDTFYLFKKNLHFHFFTLETVIYLNKVNHLAHSLSSVLFQHSFVLFTAGQSKWMTEFHLAAFNLLFPVVGDTWLEQNLLFLILVSPSLLPQWQRLFGVISVPNLSSKRLNEDCSYYCYAESPSQRCILSQEISGFYEVRICFHAILSFHWI